MERQGEKSKEIPKEVEEKAGKELDDLRKELARLKELKRQKELQEVEENEIIEEEGAQDETSEKNITEDIETRLDRIEDFLTSKLGDVDSKAYKQHSEQIEKELEAIEQEIVGEKGVVAKEVSTYELLLNDHPWLEEKRYVDFESWKSEWSKVIFDYARYAILHILYLRKLQSEKPFSKFEDRHTALEIIAEDLVEKNQALWLSKSKEKLRIYWKTLDNWAEEIYEWVMEISPLEPILIFEIRESNKDFSNLPKEDLIEIFKMLEKNERGRIIKSEDGQISFKIKVE
ncbi:MAG: hypothetical protein ACXACC_01265 [Promethearchaeota archaeon]|jgi:hypothetical protein